MYKKITTQLNKCKWKRPSKTSLLSYTKMYKNKLIFDQQLFGCIQTAFSQSLSSSSSLKYALFLILGFLESDDAEVCAPSS